MNVPNSYGGMAPKQAAPSLSPRGSGGTPSPAAPTADEADLDSGRRGWIMVLISLLLAVGFVAVFFLGSATHRIKVAPVAAPPVAAADLVDDEHLTLGMMLAPGTTVSRRVAGMPGAAAGDVMMALPPEEPLADIAAKLSGEWALATLSKSENTTSKQAQTEAATPRAPSANAPQSTATPRSVASSGANKASSTPAATAKKSEAAIENVLGNGITMRVYRNEPLSTESLRAQLAKELAVCRSHGFIAGEACRFRVCNPYWGKVPECPYQDPLTN